MAAKDLIIAIDVGATKINSGLVKNNRVLYNFFIKTEKHKGKAKVLKNIKSAIDPFIRHRPRAIGISFAGLTDHKRGVILRATNMPSYIKNTNLKKIVSGWFKKPVFLEHDGICFALAEAVLGPGRKYKNVVGMTLGTGIGGGIIINKKIYHGSFEVTELGHQWIAEDGAPCSCGRRQHLESFVSGPAMTYFYRRSAGRTLDPLSIEKMAYAGDKKALGVIDIMGRHLGIGLANIAHLLSPDIIILGGGLSRATQIIKRARQEFDKILIYPVLKKTKIEKSKIEDNALLLGAALITTGKY
jgi:glucokinase